MSPDDRTQSLRAADKRYLWHPFTQMREWLDDEPLIIESAEGCRLFDTDGNAYLDGVASLWCNVHGHRHPRLDAALTQQVSKVSHSTLLGLSNPPAIELAERLISIVPDGLSRVFYSENGASAVEAALKIAYQYWRNLGEDKKTRFVALDLAYHGDTLGAVSVGGIDIYHAAYRPLLFDVLRAPTPYVYRSSLVRGDPEGCRDACLARLEAILEAHYDEVAAVIVEPLVQGAAGIIVHPDGYLSGVRDLCDRYGTLLICDEVATGFGKTARMFACQHESVMPDLLVLGKGITGGYLPLSATLTTEEVFEAFLGPYEEMKTFFHGHTYSGNPLACAVALANLDVFEEEKTLEALPDKARVLASSLAKFEDHPNVGDIRQKGLMAGVELVRDKLSQAPFDVSERVAWRVSKNARNHGVIVRPLGDVLVFMPPLAISKEEIQELVGAVYESLCEILPP